MRINKKFSIIAGICIVIIAIAVLLLLLSPARINKDDITSYTDYLTLTDTLPHNTDSFTEGLFVADGCLYESTGLKGESQLLKDIDLSTGTPESSIHLDDNKFGEGSTLYKGNIYMLTYTSHEAYVFDSASLELLDTLEYSREGWGLTTNQEYLIASDGSSKLYFMDANLNTIKTINVHYKGHNVKNINELEYIEGKIWANVWEKDYILIIDPETGNVEYILSFAELVPDKAELKGGDSVLNGIAYDAEKKTVYLTGKNWPVLYQFDLKNML